MPSGTGGVVLDGTYTMIAITEYPSAQSSGPCPQAFLLSTLVISGACWQEVDGAELSLDASLPNALRDALRASSIAMVNGNQVTLRSICAPLNGRPETIITFTANSGTLTLFNPDEGSVSVFTKQTTRLR
jgi:hypothetical protein